MRCAELGFAEDGCQHQCKKLLLYTLLFKNFKKIACNKIFSFFEL